MTGQVTQAETAATSTARPLPTPIAPELRATLDRVMTSLRTDQQGTLQIDVSRDGAEGQVVHRLNRVWTFGAWGATTWSGQYAFGGRLAATW